MAKRQVEAVATAEVYITVRVLLPLRLSLKKKVNLGKALKLAVKGQEMDSVTLESPLTGEIVEVGGSGVIKAAHADLGRLVEEAVYKQVSRGKARYLDHEIDKES